MRKILRILRYDWPLHFVLLLTNWLPDNVAFLRFRGALCRPFLGKCGRDLRLGRNLTFYNPILIHIGDHVYIASGCLFMADAIIKVQNEVLFGPYCVISSGNHTSKNGSYRYGAPQLAPITIGRGSWVAAQVVITAGSIIGENSLIAAGAVVTGEIGSNVIAGGIPARVLKEQPARND